MTTFNQSRHPCIAKITPSPKTGDNKSKSYPPGHGDLYNTLMHLGALDQLLVEDKYSPLVYNSDHPSAAVNDKTLMYGRKLGRVHEVDRGQDKGTPRGRVPIDRKGSIRLLEVVQIHSEHVEDFGYPVCIYQCQEHGRSRPGCNLVMRHSYRYRDQAFHTMHGVNVSRSYILPVQSCLDLLLVKLNIYLLQHGQLVAKFPEPHIRDDVDHRAGCQLQEECAVLETGQEDFLYHSMSGTTGRRLARPEVGFGRNVTLCDNH
ncbi:hypothetical protein CERSUDRAFT_88357 [Gelatoporia subvermispora B]|uniref:UTP--glucose-1-phosphate uridylyltransferase n=1 Tax=Ceriporiopsis subvermispora (strain B) TaxID=914234 RepID=M2QZQ7_CERS8|nr:hypothetical protein CERSUDRAFT_88357 [Gelatoporia subvermispora B]